MIDSDYFGELFCQDLTSLNHRIAIGVANYIRLPGAELHRTWYDNFKTSMTTPFTMSTELLPNKYIYRVEVYVKKDNGGHLFYREFSGGTLTYDIIASLREEIAPYTDLVYLDDCEVTLDQHGVLKIRLEIYSS